VEPSSGFNNGFQTSQPNSNYNSGGFQSNPSTNSGFQSSPNSNSGYQSSQNSNSGFQSSPNTNSGFQTNQITSTNSANPFLSTNNNNNYDSSSVPVVGDVSLLTKINSGSSFGSVNPAPVFETAYPQTQNFNSQTNPVSSSSSFPTSGSNTFLGNFQTPNSNLGIPPSGFPSANNNQADSYGTPLGPVVSSSNTITPNSGFSSLSNTNQQVQSSGVPVLNGQIVGTGFQSSDSYGSPNFSGQNTGGGTSFSAQSGYGGPGASGFNTILPVANQVVPALSIYGAPSQPFQIGPSTPIGQTQASFGSSTPIIGGQVPGPPLPTPTVPPQSGYGGPNSFSSPVIPISSSYGVPLGQVIGEQLTPSPKPTDIVPNSYASSLPVDTSYVAALPPAVFDPERDFQNTADQVLPDTKPSLGAFIGSLDQVPGSYEGPSDFEGSNYSYTDLENVPPTPRSNPPSLASTFLHVQQGDYDNGEPFSS